MWENLAQAIRNFFQPKEIAPPCDAVGKPHKWTDDQFGMHCSVCFMRPGVGPIMPPPWGMGPP